jgi:ribosomal subunit interface protein
MINIHIRGNAMSLTPVIEEYIHKKSASFEKYVEVGSSADLHVEVGKTTAHHKQGDVFRAEFDLKIDGKQFRSVAETTELYAAIDIAKDEMLEEIRSNKDKSETLFRRGARRVKDIVRGFYKSN